MAHARRKFFDLQVASQRPLVATALEFISRLYEVERLLTDVEPQERLRLRTACAMLEPHEHILDWPHLADDIRDELQAACPGNAASETTAPVADSAHAAPSGPPPPPTLTTALPTA